MDHEDIDDLSKTLLHAFAQSYIETFHPDVLEYTDVALCQAAPNEIRIPSFRPKRRAKRLFSDIVLRIPFNAVGLANFGDDYDDFVLSTEPQTGDTTALGERMPFYKIGIEHMFPDSLVAITALYFDAGLEGLGTDYYLEGQIAGLEPPRRKPPLKASPVIDPATLTTTNALAFSWSYVGLPALDGEVYLQKARTQPIAAALLGFMRLDPERRPAVQAEAILLIDGYNLNDDKKNLLVRGLLAGMNLNDEDHRRFLEIIQQHPDYRRTNTVITTWFDQGKAEGKSDGLQIAALLVVKGRFGSADFAADQIKKMSVEQLSKLLANICDMSKQPSDLGLVNGAQH